MHILLWMNVMLDSISMFSPSCEEQDWSENVKWNYDSSGIHSHARYGQRKVMQRSKPLGHRTEMIMYA